MKKINVTVFGKLPSKIPNFFFWGFLKMLPLRYWEGRFINPDIIRKKGIVEIK